MTLSSNASFLTPTPMPPGNSSTGRSSLVTNMKCLFPLMGRPTGSW